MKNNPDSLYCNCQQTLFNSNISPSDTSGELPRTVQADYERYHQEQQEQREREEAERRRAAQQTNRIVPGPGSCSI